MDAALIQQCADPALKPVIVEQFVAAVGSDDPLSVSIKSGGRLILVPKPETPEEAMGIVRQYVGQAVVRVGLTQFPAGVGVTDVSELGDDLVDACANLKKGTSMFAKILRIVTKWYGNPKSEEVFPQIFEDAVYAWKTGEFEGQSVFQAEDPGGKMPPAVEVEKKDPDPQQTELEPQPKSEQTDERQENSTDPNGANMRIDLSHIGVERNRRD